MSGELAALRIERDEEPPRGRGRWLVALAIVLVAVAAWYFWPRAEPLRTVQVSEELVSAAPIADSVLDASGYVTARRRATLSAKITGKVVEVLVEEGVAVEAGEVVARLDDTLQRASRDLAAAERRATERALAETESRIELARLEATRAERLFADGVIGQAELDRRQAELRHLERALSSGHEQVRVAAHRLERAEVELADTVVRAPFAGVVVSKDAQPGEMVSPISAGGGFTRTGLCTVVDMSSLEIEVEVNEAYISRVRPDQPIEARLDAYPDEPMPGHVITTIPTADRQKATVLVRVGFDRLDPRLLPEMGVKVRFLGEAEPLAAEASDEPAPRTLVPVEAIVSDDGRDVVFVVDGGRVERRALRLGPTIGGRRVVLAGLRAGETVILKPPATLADGDRVRVEGS